MAKPKNQDLFKKFGIAFVKKDVDTVAQCLSDDFVWSLPDGATYEGKPAALQAMAQRFADPGGPRFADSNFRFFGDTIVQTYQVTAGGKTLKGTDVYQVRDGLICSKDAYWKQLG